MTGIEETKTEEIPTCCTCGHTFFVWRVHAGDPYSARTEFQYLLDHLPHDPRCEKCNRPLLPWGVAREERDRLQGLMDQIRRQVLIDQRLYRLQVEDCRTDAGFVFRDVLFYAEDDLQAEQQSRRYVALLARRLCLSGQGGWRPHHFHYRLSVVHPLMNLMDVQVAPEVLVRQALLSPTSSLEDLLDEC